MKADFLLQNITGDHGDIMQKNRPVLPHLFDTLFPGILTSYGSSEHWRVNPADGAFQEIESQKVVQRGDVLGKLYNVSKFPVIGHTTHKQVLVCLSSDDSFLSAMLSEACPAANN